MESDRDTRRKIPIALSLSYDAHQMLVKLGDEKGLSRSSVVELAVRDLFRDEKLELAER